MNRTEVLHLQQQLIELFDERFIEFDIVPAASDSFRVQARAALCPASPIILPPWTGQQDASTLAARVVQHLVGVHIFDALMTMLHKDSVQEWVPGSRDQDWPVTKRIKLVDAYLSGTSLKVFFTGVDRVAPQFHQDCWELLGRTSDSTALYWDRHV